MQTNSDLVWTDDMREISGFGGGYEDACRLMTAAGVKWLEANREKMVDLGAHFGFGADEDTAKANRRAFDDAVAAVDDGCTGAQHGAACSHAAVIFWQGWDAYVAKMRAQKASEAA